MGKKKVKKPLKIRSNFSLPLLFEYLLALWLLVTMVLSFFVFPMYVVKQGSDIAKLTFGQYYGLIQHYLVGTGDVPNEILNSFYNVFLVGVCGIPTTYKSPIGILAPTLMVLFLIVMLGFFIRSIYKGVIGRSNSFVPFMIISLLFLPFALQPIILKITSLSSSNPAKDTIGLDITNNLIILGVYVLILIIMIIIYRVCLRDSISRKKLTTLINLKDPNEGLVNIYDAEDKVLELQKENEELRMQLQQSSNVVPVAIEPEKPVTEELQEPKSEDVKSEETKVEEPLEKPNEVVAEKPKKKRTSKAKKADEEKTEKVEETTKVEEPKNTRKPRAKSKAAVEEPKVEEIKSETIEITPAPVIEIVEPEFENKDAKLDKNLRKLDMFQFTNNEDLIYVRIPKNVKAIGESCFANCPNVTDVVIHENVTKIGMKAFNECSKLEKVTYLGTVDMFKAMFVGGGAFANTKVKIIKCSDGEINIDNM